MEINKFLDRYEEFYNDFKPEHIRAKIKYGYHCDTDQIICHLNKIDIKDSAYYKFYQIVKTNFNISNIKILEVACGYIPILSKILKVNTNSQITAINKKILFNNYGNITTKEVDLTNNYNISSYDLIVGFRPCHTTEIIIDLCFKYKKDFIIYLCPCDLKPLHKTPNNIESAEDWRKYIINKVKSNNNYNSLILNNHNLQDDLPIIIAHYKKSKF